MFLKVPLLCLIVEAVLTLNMSWQTVVVFLVETSLRPLQGK